VINKGRGEGVREGERRRKGVREGEMRGVSEGGGSE